MEAVCSHLHQGELVPTDAPLAVKETQPLSFTDRALEIKDNPFGPISEGPSAPGPDSSKLWASH